MRERPILFSGPMVRAILAGTKTQTRRLAKLPDDRGAWEPTTIGGPGCTTSRGKPVPEMVAIWNTTTGKIIASPYLVGDQLWVKESFRLRADQDDKPPRDDWWKSGAWYAADGPSSMPSGCAGGAGRLRPAIHMPRWASRITLAVTDVRVQRLLDITEQDAKAEGCEPYVNGHGPITLAELQAEPGYGHPHMYRHGFEFLWDAINGKRAPWSANPWVWAVTFKRVEQAP